MVKAIATPAAVLLLGAVNPSTGVRISHDVHLDARLFERQLVRPRVELYAEHRKYSSRFSEEVIGGAADEMTIEPPPPFVWRMLGWLLAGA